MKGADFTEKTHDITTPVKVMKNSNILTFNNYSPANSRKLFFNASVKGFCERACDRWMDGWTFGFNSLDHARVKDGEDKGCIGREKALFLVQSGVSNYRVKCDRI